MPRWPHSRPVRFLLLGAALIGGLVLVRWTARGDTARPREAVRSTPLAQDDEEELLAPAILEPPAGKETTPDRAAVSTAETPARPAVAGVLLAPDGSPSRGTITLHRNLDGLRRTENAPTDEEGRFRFATELTRGAFALSVQPSRSHGGAVLAPLPERTDDLTLQRVEARTLRVEARDPDGAPVAPFAAFAFLILGDDAVWRVDGPRLPRGEIPVPAGRFEVHASAKGYRRGTFGPFDPDTVRSSVVVTLTPRPRIRGRVTKDGAPAAGVRVLAELDLRGTPGIDLEPRAAGAAGSEVGGGDTDAEGRFEFPVRVSLPRVLVFRARRPDGLEGSAGPLRLDGSEAPPQVVIELDRPPGALAGRLVVPPGVAPEGHYLAARGPRESFIERASASGEFRWEGLTPGSWSVTVHEAQDFLVAPGERLAFGGHEWEMLALMPSPSWATGAAYFPVRVRPGETAKLVLDPRDANDLHLIGRIRAEGPTPDRFSIEGGARLLLEGDRRALAAHAPVVEGCFELVTRVAGTFLLRVDLTVDGEPGGLEILDRVTLSSRRDSWDLTLSLGRLVVHLPEHRYELRHLHRTPSGARILSTAMRNEEGAFVFPAAHAGEGEVFVDDRGQRRILAECDVPPGGELVVDLRR